MEEEKPFKRLSKAVQPINYKLTLKPNLQTFTCPGDEIIDVDIKREINRFTIHSVDIDILSVKIVAKEKEHEPKIVYKPEKETATFLFPENLPEGHAKMYITFNCTLGDKLKGFYRTKYKTTLGEERYSASTQFATTHARRAFPCFDEPAMKASFDITLVAPKHLVLLSNMDVDYEEDDATNELLKVVHYNKTPVMSTYLVAFAVGEYDYVEDKTTNGVVVRVYTPRGKSEQGKFALQVAVKTLPFYTEYFGIPYPLPKLDLIAVPDLEYGAMENWGLVTYRESCVLVDPVESSAAVNQQVALVVGHELAHMWFGNITTMEWWTHLWLNEGFASWIEYLCVDHCCPQFNIWTQFVSSEMGPALRLDALQNSHPIEVPCGHPSEIEEIFDAISYCKGACIIHMLHNFIGTDAFRAGLKSYLNHFKYSNASTDDLWEHLETASKKPVKRVMSTWTQQMGYPVLAVSSEKTGNQTILKINQKKFNSNGCEDVANSLWEVPISLSTSDNPCEEKYSSLLSERDMVIFLDVQPDRWIKLNPGQKGFYRTLYSKEMLEELIPGIKHLPSVDRVGIQSDLFALSIAGYASTVDYLKLLSGYSEETDYTVWSDIINNLVQLGVILQGTELHGKYKEYVVKLCQPVLEKLGLQPRDGEDHKTSLLRSILISRLGVFGEPGIIIECQRRFRSHVDGTESIPADIRSAVYSTVAVHGNEQTINEMMALYRKTDHTEERSRIGTCLGMNEDPSAISKVLSFALSDDVRIGDTILLMRGCTSNLTARKLMWQFTKANWDTLYERYKAGVMLTRLIATATKYFATQSDADDIQSFFKEVGAPGTERTVNQSLESIATNRKWLERDGDKITTWINA